ncbi:hypothetical protein ACFQDP_05850 [Methylorubrum zatmanii]|uniref:Uncharacterized protein n=1 Tax=Methylorubrum zatmanii TaxID=29429 RepID=A0ABW1WKE8_9HYPH
MSSRSRIRTLLLVAGAILTIGPAHSQDGTEPKPREGSEIKASGNWTDPPAKPATPPTPAAATRTTPPPARADVALAPARKAAKQARHSAKLRRQTIRTVASRAERPTRMQAARTISRPTRHVAASPRPVNWPVARGRPRPVYGYIEPEAPAEAYYERRRFGTIGSGPASLGLPQEAAPFDRFAGMPASGRLIVRWRGATFPPGYAGSGPWEPDAFDPE